MQATYPLVGRQRAMGQLPSNAMRSHGDVADLDPASSTTGLTLPSQRWCSPVRSTSRSNRVARSSAAGPRIKGID